MPGIIFKDTRTIRIAFRDQDRAEELICLLNENWSLFLYLQHARVHWEETLNSFKFKRSHNKRININSGLFTLLPRSSCSLAPSALLPFAPSSSPWFPAPLSVASASPPPPTGPVAYWFLSSTWGCPEEIRIPSSTGLSSPQHPWSSCTSAYCHCYNSGSSSHIFWTTPLL